MSTSNTAATLARLTSIDTDDCVLWPYAVNSSGYGRVHRHGAREYAHRLACESAHGPAPEGTVAAHWCGNRRCVNPRHLRWATHLENMRDSVDLHRTSPKGERHGSAKLKESDVRFIRQQIALGARQDRLAERLGVAKNTITSIKKGRSWQWLE